MEGTISSGTLKDSDLIPRFLDALETLDPISREAMGDLYPVQVEHPGYCQRHDLFDCWFCESPEVRNLMEDLFDLLDLAAPKGTYFGAHPGDGADFGFWAVK
jgi:hypothetical protein